MCCGVGVYVYGAEEEYRYSALRSVQAVHRDNE
jgi:hypothetical protein